MITSSRSVLVTGGTGFLGRHLTQALLDQGDRVICVVRNEAAPLPDGVERIVWAGEPRLLHEGIANWRPDVALHLAALSSGDHRIEDIEPMVEAGFHLGVQLLDALSAAGSRGVVRAGTFWEHDSRTGEPGASSLYAAIKSALDPVAQYYFARRGLSSVDLELFDIYGPHDHRLRLMDLLTTRAGNEPLGLSPGYQQLDLVHVSDVVSAFLVAVDGLMSGKFEGNQRFAVRGQDRMSLRDVVAVVEEVRGLDLAIEWGARPYRECDVMLPCSTCTPIPGWEPQTRLRDGIRGLIAD